MASFTYGFYNAIDGDRTYDAVQMSEIFDGIISDGVYATVGSGFIVKETLEDDAVLIGSGRAWFNHTWNKLDFDMFFMCPAAESNINRIDAIVIEIDSGSRINEIKYIKGTPEVNPVKPTLINNDTIHQHPLCYIRRLAGVKRIEQSYIENCVGTTETPWVTGVIKTLDASELYLRWNAEWNEWLANNQVDWSNVKKEYDTQWKIIQQEHEAQWEEIKNKLIKEQNTIVDGLNQWSIDQMKYIKDLIAEMHDLLDSDPALSLQMQIDTIKERVYKIVYGFEEKETFETENGVTIEQFEDGRKIETRELENGDIEQRYYLSNGILKWVKIVHEKEDGTIVERVTNYIYNYLVDDVNNIITDSENNAIIVN